MCFFKDFLPLVTIGALVISVETAVRGYHIYDNFWTACVGEDLPCKYEDGDRVDYFTIDQRQDNCRSLYLHPLYLT